MSKYGAGFMTSDDPDELYYIQNIRILSQECVSWWKPDGNGYTLNLDEAGLYTL